MSFEDLAYTVDGGVALITINRPKNLNAFLLRTYRELAQALRLAAGDASVAVTVLTGAGRFFSSGADVTDTAPDPSTPEERRTAYRTRFDGSIAVVARALAEHPKVFIIGFNGPAVGYAAAIVSHGDIIIASDSATLHAPFTSLAISPEGGTSYTFVKRMGVGRAMEALLFGKKFTAQELADIGFVNKILPDSEFHAALMSHVKSLTATVAPASLIVTKGLVKSAYQRDLVRAINEEVGELTERFVTGEPQRVFAQLAAKHSAKAKSKL